MATPKGNSVSIFPLLPHSRHPILEEGSPLRPKGPWERQLAEGGDQGTWEGSALLPLPLQILASKARGSSQLCLWPSLDLGGARGGMSR